MNLQRSFRQTAVFGVSCLKSTLMLAVSEKRRKRMKIQALITVLRGMAFIFHRAQSGAPNTWSDYIPCRQDRNFSL